MYDNLTKKQSEILKFINKFIAENGYSPSIREICAATGFKSTSSVHAHLKTLEHYGYVAKSSLKKRALTPINMSRYLDVPILGKVTAGAPILAVENIEGYFPLTEDFARNKEIFMLAVSGDSMINAGILELCNCPETEHCQNGDINCAGDCDEATVKTFYSDKNGVRLQPQNDAYEPIIAKNVEVLGKVTGIFRKL